MIFRARQFEFVFPRPALVMGVVNVTPDSFSDGGKFLDVNDAVAHALKLVAQGADILDIGGESTRPGAQPVSEAGELQRVIPVIQKLAPQISIPISIDTTKSAVARAALTAGASIVNDVSANRENDDLWKIVSDFHAGYVCMHAFPGGTEFADENIIREVGEFFQEQLGNLLNRIGVIPEQVVLDPGIGFGKTPEQNLSLLAHLRSFARLRRPLLLGASRKSFIGKLLGADVNERLPASLACATLAIESGVQIIRAHDVAETIQAVRLTESVLSRKKNVA
jgi:dihydropteroate synthase